MLLGTLQGILVAVIASLLALAQQAYNPPVYVLGRKRGTDVFRPRSSEHPDDESWPGLLIVRIEGRALLPQRAAHRRQDVAAHRAGEAGGRAARLPRARSTSSTRRSRCSSRAKRSCAQQGITLWLAALNPEVLKVVQQSPLGETLGRERMFFNLQSAVSITSRWS